jgi:hypothetical protein
MVRDASTDTGGRSDSRSVTIRTIVGYQHCIWSFTCGECGSDWFFPSKPSWHEPSRYGPAFPIVCECTNCGATNKFASISIQPNIPKFLSVGDYKDAPLEIYPVPPDLTFAGTAAGYFPYSTRSFIHQASRELGGCSHECYEYGPTLGGEPVFTDICGVLDGEDCQVADQRCHVFSGWPHAEHSCQLWDRVAELCQTDDEANVLRYYLSLVKGRNFPMLIPQARLGIAERRRPDFVLFVPLQSLKYRRYAIELDGGHIGDEFVASDQERNKELILNKYLVRNLRSGEEYYKEVKDLVEQVEAEMSQADQDLKAVAVKREVHSYE